MSATTTGTTVDDYRSPSSVPSQTMRQVDADPAFSESMGIGEDQGPASSSALFATLLRMASAVLTSRVCSNADVGGPPPPSLAASRSPAPAPKVRWPQHSGVPMSQEQTAVKHSIAAAVSSTLGQACYLNEALGLHRAMRRTSFDCPAQKRAAISLVDYVERAMRYTPAGKEAYVLSLVYLSHYLARHTREVVLTRANVHRLWMSAFVVASKFLDDEFLSNGCYAKVAGLPVAELNVLERTFLVGLNYACASDRCLEDYWQLARPMLALVAKARLLASSNCQHSDDAVAALSPSSPFAAALATGMVVTAVKEISESFRRAVKTLRDSLQAAAAAAKATLQLQLENAALSLARQHLHRPPSFSVSFVLPSQTQAQSPSPVLPNSAGGQPLVASRRPRRSSSLSAPFPIPITTSG